MHRPRPASPALVAALLLALAPAAARADTAAEAKKALAEGRPAEAADLFARVLEKGAKDPEVVRGFAEAVVEADREDLLHEAEQALHERLGSEPGDHAARVLLGEVYLKLAATKSDPQGQRVTYVDAEDHFRQVCEAEPMNEGAAVGLARARYGQADFGAAGEILDAFLAKSPKDPADALYWRGETYYIQAGDAFRQAGGTYPLDDATSQLFRNAQHSYAAAGAADPENYDAWIKLGYASQYLGDTAEADRAYRKALALRKDTDAPLRGLEALYTHTPAEHAKVLSELVDEHPDHPWVRFHRGTQAARNQQWATAVANLERAANDPRTKANAAYWLGWVHTQQGDSKAARKAYEDALEANPDNTAAAGALEALVRDNRSPAELVRTLDLHATRQLVREYEKLFALAPRDPNIRNNLGFILRDLWVAHRREPSWRPILEKAVEVYEEAASIIGEWQPQMRRTMAWATRYAYAGILSDTALMYQFHEPVRDLDKAKAHYERALEFSDDGYFDAWNNLRQIHEQAGDDEALLDLAERAADNLVHQDGTPHHEGRAQAQAVVERLR